MAAANLWFAGKSVLVTGGGSGIGRAAARRFADEGARVCVADLNAANARKVADQIVTRGGQAFACQADITREADNERMVQEAVKAHGGLDIAFLNAGLGGVPFDALNGDLNEFDRIISANLKGVYLGLRGVNRVIRPGGAIVVTASVGGITGVAFNPIYAASKHGVVGLVRSLAETFSEKGVRINAICPGGVNTPMIGRGSDDLDVAPDDLPLPVYRSRVFPEHIAESVLFLASKRAAAITGSCMVVDNGQTTGFAQPRQAEPARG